MYGCDHDRVAVYATKPWYPWKHGKFDVHHQALVSLETRQI